MDNETKAMFQEILSELKTINKRLDSLEAGQAKLEAGQKALEAGQESIKQHITANNVAIGEVVTQALESNDSKVSKIEKVTKDNLYEIALLKHAK